MTDTIAKPSWRSALVYAFAGGLIVAAVLGGGYLWLRQTPVVPSGGAREHVTLATNTEYAGSCPIFVAQAQDYFGSAGLLVTIQPYTSGKAALDATLRGQANLGTVGDVPIMFAVMNGQPVAVIATIFKAEKDHGITGRKDKGIVTPAHLNGKRIGVTLGTTAHFFLDAFLNWQKLSASDVEMRNFKPEELPEALLQGDVDAISAWEPFLRLSHAPLGGNGTIFYGADVYELTFNIAGTREYIVSHPETIKKMLRALVRGAHFCRDMPEVAREIVARGMKTEATKLQELWPSYRFHVTLDQSLVLALEDETRWAVKNQLVERTDMPNYLQYLHLEALKAVAPAAVTVIH